MRRAPARPRAIPRASARAIDWNRIETTWNGWTLVLPASRLQDPLEGVAWLSIWGEDADALARLWRAGVESTIAWSGYAVALAREFPVPLDGTLEVIGSAVGIRLSRHVVLILDAIDEA